jgi:hypothetical protein
MGKNRSELILNLKSAYRMRLFASGGGGGGKGTPGVLLF